MNDDYRKPNDGMWEFLCSELSPQVQPGEPPPTLLMPRALHGPCFHAGRAAARTPLLKRPRRPLLLLLQQQCSAPARGAQQARGGAGLVVMC